MKVKSIHVHRGYGDGPLRGEIKFEDKDGTELKIRLDEKLSAEVVCLCADAIARAGQEAAKSLTSQALAVNAIEHDGGNDE